jgi:hypothetical protein
MPPACPPACPLRPCPRPPGPPSSSAPPFPPPSLPPLSRVRRIIKLVRAIRKGWLKTSEQKHKAEEPPVYMLWGDDSQTADKTATGLSYIPAAKPKLPGHEESYNPPAEYLPSEVTRAARPAPALLPRLPCSAHAALRLHPCCAPPAVLPTRPTPARPPCPTPGGACWPPAAGPLGAPRVCATGLLLAARRAAVRRLHQGAL